MHNPGSLQLGTEQQLKESEQLKEFALAEENLRKEFEHLQRKIAEENQQLDDEKKQLEEKKRQLGDNKRQLVSFLPVIQITGMCYES